jgi:hypothetical protein
MSFKNQSKNKQQKRKLIQMRIKENKKKSQKRDCVCPSDHVFQRKTNAHKRLTRPKIQLDSHSFFMLAKISYKNRRIEIIIILIRLFDCLYL